MNYSILLLGLVMVTGASHAQTGSSAKQAVIQVRPLPEEAVRLYSKLASKMMPTARLKIQGAAMKVRSQPAANASEMLAHARTAGWEAFPALRATDVDVATYLVMMQAATDVQEELTATMQRMQAANNQKRGAGAKLSDMSQEMEMKLQIEQEQYSQCVEAVSNMVKKVSDTSASIVQNIK